MFRVGNLDDLVYCVKKFVFIDGDLTRQTIGIPLLDKIIGMTLNLGTGVKIVTGAVLLICMIFFMHNDYTMKKVRDVMTIDWIQYVSSLQLKYWIVYLTIMFFLLLCLTPSSSPQFIYFQF